jgi:hypothetical protein
MPTPPAWDKAKKKKKKILDYTELNWICKDYALILVNLNLSTPLGKYFKFCTLVM